MNAPLVLVIAGHDPCGGAGIQADLEALASTGCRGASVVTALTVQDTRCVSGFSPTPGAMIKAQAEAVLNDLTVAVIKIGMIGSEENVMAIAELLSAWPHIPVVLDPVLAGGGGGSLSRGHMAARIRECLLPRVTLITPNTPEARLLCPETDNDPSCARALLASGCQYALVTGGHEPGENVANLLWHRDGCVDRQVWPRLPGEFHGSGCTLASACAGFMAQGFNVTEATRLAQAYTWQTLQHATSPGKGQHLPQRYYWWPTQTLAQLLSDRPEDHSA